MKILMGMPCASGTMSSIMVNSLLQLHKPLPCGFLVVDRQRIDRARNIIALQALQGEFDYLFFVDDDNPIPPDTLEKFVEDDKDIVMAPILTRNPDKDGKHNLCAYYQEIVSDGDSSVRIYNFINEFKDSGPLHRIDAGGTGAMLIKRKVLETLFKKYNDRMFEFGETNFEEVEVNGKKYDRRTMSEDVEFCERAVDAGFQVWLDDRIRPIHMTGNNFVKYE